MAVETLGQAFDFGWRVRIRCAHGKRDGMKSVPACLYRAELDMETLVCTRGRDFPLSWLQNYLKCPRCGSRRIVVMFEPPPATRRVSI